MVNEGVGLACERFLNRRDNLGNKKANGDVMRPDYDFSSGVRGKYLPRLAEGANVVVLDRDMAKVFPTSKAVNDALRVLAEAGRRHRKAKGSTRGVRTQGVPKGVPKPKSQHAYVLTDT